MTLTRRVAVVTGASTGIGQATAVALGQIGVKVFLTARSIEGLEATKKLVESVGGQATEVRADLSDLKQVKNLIKSIKDSTETVDYIVNIAGVWHGRDEVYANTDFLKFSEKVILDTYAVGFTSPSLIVHGLLPLMSPGSSIVNLSGTFSNGAKGWLPYYASKRALEDFTIGLAEDLRESGIRANCVSPADTATLEYQKYYPEYLDDALDPTDVATFIVGLCTDSKDSGKVYVLRKGVKPMEGFHQ